ncbi:nicotinate phosphoribosyltransferase [Acetobacter orientalis]|uniref:Nicotinate phosphoribosyltransferase n=1 Tax=Acetobacter orientalis TaxID=146474 RepID=A0A2Z5ZD26_9PROT|nr:nicotinate phosphoribosyltransferase [Acetobacter orientalis]
METNRSKGWCGMACLACRWRYGIKAFNVSLNAHGWVKLP